MDEKRKLKGKENMYIFDDALLVYYPIVCAGRSDEEIFQMEKRMLFHTDGRIRSTKISLWIEES